MLAVDVLTFDDIWLNDCQFIDKIISDTFMGINPDANVSESINEEKNWRVDTLTHHLPEDITY